jgi:hypothetical protein
MVYDRSQLVPQDLYASQVVKLLEEVIYLLDEVSGKQFDRDILETKLTGLSLRAAIPAT